jgi:predicted ATPase
MKLRTDGANLPSVLLRLRGWHKDYYKRIVDTIRLVAPFFDDFVLHPSTEDRSRIFLNWKDRDPESSFGPHLLSDGTLRAMCLIALLLQPEHLMPKIIVIDEPELGLHPYAIDVIAGLLRGASQHAQIIVATQSPQLISMFQPEEIIVAENHEGNSVFKRPDAKELESWLAEYTIAELWEKNVIGGRPSAWSS